jgi:hypothetical protein
MTHHRKPEPSSVCLFWLNWLKSVDPAIPIDLSNLILVALFSLSCHAGSLSASHYYRRWSPGLQHCVQSRMVINFWSKLPPPSSGLKSNVGNNLQDYTMPRPPEVYISTAVKTLSSHNPLNYSSTQVYALPLRYKT